MKFDFQLATNDNLLEIMNLMTFTRKTVIPKEWFVDDTAEYVENIINGQGFVVLAKPENNYGLAGFFIVKFPGTSCDNLGNYLHLSADQLLFCAHMDSVAVYPDYRGHHLQTQMAEFAEKLLCQFPYRYLFATVHPENTYSLNNMLSCGYQIVVQTKLYGGLNRVIIFKEL